MRPQSTDSRSDSLSLPFGVALCAAYFFEVMKLSSIGDTLPTSLQYVQFLRCAFPGTAKNALVKHTVESIAFGIASAPRWSRMTRKALPG